MDDDAGWGYQGGTGYPHKASPQPISLVSLADRRPHAALGQSLMLTLCYFRNRTPFTCNGNILLHIYVSTGHTMAEQGTRVIVNVNTCHKRVRSGSFGNEVNLQLFVLNTQT